jgi:hypothetical protein
VAKVVKFFGSEFSTTEPSYFRFKHSDFGSGTRLARAISPLTVSVRAPGSVFVHIEVLPAILTIFFNGMFEDGLIPAALETALWGC